MVPVVGYIDGVSSAFIAFSIFYLPAVFLGTWFGNRLIGVLVAIAAALAGFAADSWALHAAWTYAYMNLCLRLILFALASLVISRLRDAMRRERDTKEMEREAAASLRAVGELKNELMRSVAIDAGAPLGAIYAAAVALMMSEQDLSSNDARELVQQIADASSSLSNLVNELIKPERLDSSATAALTEPR